MFRRMISKINFEFIHAVFVATSPAGAHLLRAASQTGYGNSLHRFYPPRGSHRAAPIATSCGWTEVSHRLLVIALQLRHRAVIDQMLVAHCLLSYFDLRAKYPQAVLAHPSRRLPLSGGRSRECIRVTGYSVFKERKGICLSPHTLSNGEVCFMRRNFKFLKVFLTCVVSLFFFYLRLTG